MESAHATLPWPLNLFASFLSFSAARDGGRLALFVFLCTALSFAASRKWRRAAPALLYPEEAKLEKLLRATRAEAQKHRGADELHIHAKLTREALVIAQRIEKLRSRRRLFAWGGSKYATATRGEEESLEKGEGLGRLLGTLKCVLPSIVFVMLRFGFMIPILYFYYDRSAIVVIPHGFRFSLPNMQWVQWVISTLVDPVAWVRDYGKRESLETLCHEEQWGLGVVGWFIACYISVRFLDRVMLRI